MPSDGTSGTSPLSSWVLVAVEGGTLWMDTGCVGTEERSDEVANDNSPIMAIEVATDQLTAAF